MKSVLTLLAACLACSPVALPAQSAAVAGPRLRAGAAKVDISPTKADLPIATDSVRDHLYVSAVFLDDGRVEELSSGRERGAGIRVVVGETTGFAHTADLSEAETEALFQSLVKGDVTPQKAELFRAQMLTEMAKMSGRQSADVPPKATKSTRMSATTAAALVPAAMKAVTGVGAPW